VKRHALGFGPFSFQEGLLIGSEVKEIIGKEDCQGEIICSSLLYRIFEKIRRLIRRSEKANDIEMTTPTSSTEGSGSTIPWFIYFEICYVPHSFF
jgi:hypothetical protein